MPTDNRLEAAFKAFERVLTDPRHVLNIGADGARMVLDELDEAIEEAGPEALIEDPSGVVLVEVEDE